MGCAPVCRYVYRCVLMCVQICMLRCVQIYADVLQLWGICPSVQVCVPLCGGGLAPASEYGLCVPRSLCIFLQHAPILPHTPSIDTLSQTSAGAIFSFKDWRRL